jgi:hypothetical protein
MKKINFAVLIFLFASLKAVPSFSQSKLLAKEDGAIPVNFGKEKTILLVVKSPAGHDVNKALEKIFEKYYTGSYEIIKYMDQVEVKYHDSLKYGYKFNVLIDMQAGQYTTRRPGGGFERMGPANEYSFGVTDQQTKKDYSISFFKQSFTGLLEAYIKKLEEERKKNEQ